MDDELSSKYEIELIEKECIDIVYDGLKNNYNHYFTNFDQLSFNEIFLIIAGQKKGRSKLPHSIPDLVKGFEKNELDDQKKLELKIRLLSSNIFKKAFERINYSTIFQHFTEKKIPFSLNNSPNSSDFSVFIDLDQFHSTKNENYKNLNQIDGVLLNVETKTTNGFSNLSDALSENYFGKFQFEYNQATYQPPELRSTLSKINNNPYLMKKYKTNSPYYFWKGRKYLVVSIFTVFLSILKDEDILSKEFDEFNGEIFEHYSAIVCIPNSDLISEFYDNFFSAGKAEDTKDGFPGDFRFQIYKNKKGFLVFENLDSKESRFKYLKNSGNYDCLVYKDGAKLKNFQIP